MEIGVLTSLNQNVEDNIRKVAELGIPTAQLKCWNSTFLTDEYADRAAAAAREYGVKITAFWCGWDGMSYWNFYEGPLTLGLVPREYRAERMKMLLRGAGIARRMGVSDVVTHVGFLPENPASTEYHEIVAALRYIGKQLLPHGQYFLFETGQETPVTLRRTIEEVGTGNLGINLDPANLLMYGKGNPVDALDVFGQYVRGIHGKDGEYPTDGRNLGKEKPLGEGRVDYPRFIRRLREIGYDGAITIEREISGERQIEDIVKAKALLEKLISE
ncbi:MAG: sugar phosphate isomerase/epimerase [Clostridia bacterium]|nr:sugar phosphate isomerase/epimerase [Clostridia bacterium]